MAPATVITRTESGGGAQDQSAPSLSVRRGAKARAGKGAPYVKESEAWLALKLPQSIKIVAKAVALHIHTPGGHGHPGAFVLQRETGLGLSTVKLAMRALRGEPFRFHPGDEYRQLPPIVTRVWKGGRGRKPKGRGAGGLGRRGYASVVTLTPLGSTLLGLVCSSSHSTANETLPRFAVYLPKRRSVSKLTRETTAQAFSVQQLDGDNACFTSSGLKGEATAMDEGKSQRNRPRPYRPDVPQSPGRWPVDRRPPPSTPAPNTHTGDLQRAVDRLKNPVGRTQNEPQSTFTASPKPGDPAKSIGALIAAGFVVRGGQWWHPSQAPPEQGRSPYRVMDNAPGRATLHRRP